MRNGKGMNKYINSLHKTLDNISIEKLKDIVDVLSRARLGERKIFIIGNGGSSATASHFACDLVKLHSDGLPDFHVISFDNLPILTAYANDDGYDNVYSLQLKSMVKPADIVIGISASGNSKNICSAIRMANSLGAATIGFTGYDGGELGKLVTWHVNISSNDIKQIEDIHLIMTHMITRIMEW